jgi:prepilin-type N-terminal cleavage/methylation domain-containing protein
MEVAGSQKSRIEYPKNGNRTPQPNDAFTLIELLVVITIIVILMGLLFPAFRGVQDQAKKTQAKNDLTQIVTAVNAFYTEYGRYPTGATTDAAATYGTAPANLNDALFNELRGLPSATLNTRQIAFISPPDAKDGANPRSGIGTTIKTGQYFDPWGTPYNVEMDADYDNLTVNPYGNNNGAGASPLRQGIIAWSLGSDATLGDKKTSSTKFTNSDDVISWQ